MADNGTNRVRALIVDDEELGRRMLRSLLASDDDVQVVGEAARRVSEAYCSTTPSIPWKAIVGMRNKLVHDYMGVDEEMVWDTVTSELPDLIERLTRLGA